MYCNVIVEQPWTTTWILALGFLHSFSPRRLHENIAQSWRGMADAHLKIPKHFLLGGCMYLRYHILSLGYLKWRTDLARPSFSIFIQTLNSKRSRHIFSQHTSLVALLDFVPFLWPQLYRVDPAMLYETFPFFIQLLSSVMAFFLPSFCGLVCVLVLLH